MLLKKRLKNGAIVISFKKLATKYDGSEVLNYFVANFMHDPKGYIKSFSDGNYTKWKVNQESFSYKFRQDVDLLLTYFEAPYQDKFDKLFEVKEGSHPRLLRHYLAGEISLETLVVFERCLGYIGRFDKKLSDPIWKDIKKRVLNYKPFLDIDCSKYRQVILTVIRTKAYEFFQSEQVQMNLQDIFETYQEVASMTSKLGNMNKEEKLDHIEDCKGLIDKQRTFYGRLCLAAAEDAEAADMKTRINALSQAFGYSDLLECMDAMVMTLEQAAQLEVDRD